MRKLVRLHLALPAGKLSPEYAMTSVQFNWPIEKSILPSIAFLLAITWIPPLKKMDGFSVGGFLSVAISPHLKCQENQHAKNQRNHKVHHIPTWHFAVCDTHGVFFTKPKGYETQKYAVRRKLHKSPMFSFPKNPCQIKLGSFNSHPNLFGEVFQVANSFLQRFRKQFPWAQGQ